MDAERAGFTKAAAHLSVALAAASLLMFAFGIFVPVDANPFMFGEEFIISSVLGLCAVVAAWYAWLGTTQRGALHRRALKFAIGVLVLSAGYIGLFLLAYSNCPGGVC
jgi:hypothetical protein